MSDQNDADEPRDKPPGTAAKVTAIALAAVAAAALMVATFSSYWAIELPSAGIGLGLRGQTACVGGACETTSYAELAAQPDAEGAFRSLYWFGWITTGAAWLGAAMLVVSALLVAVGRMFYRPMTPTTLALLALGVALITGCVFVALARPVGTVGWAFWVFGVGVVLGLLAAQRLARFKPGDPYWDNPPPVTDDPDRW